MAVIMPYSSGVPPHKRQRRTATSVLAGVFDSRASNRDVLTSVLNGVPLYKEVERDQVSRRDKKKEKRERDRERKRVKAAAEKEKARQPEHKTLDSPEPTPSTSTAVAPTPTAPPKTKASKTSSFWRARPAIHIATNQRSKSVTPPPMPLSPQSTPGPSSSSTTSFTSSKRPRTPDDDDDEDDYDISSLRRDSDGQPPHKKKRVAVRKGWKGWIEGSPPPSEKLINLDEVQVLKERKTRSGKSFDGIGLAKDGWI